MCMPRLSDFVYTSVFGHDWYACLEVVDVRVCVSVYMRVSAFLNVNVCMSVFVCRYLCLCLWLCFVYALSLLL